MKNKLLLLMMLLAVGVSAQASSFYDWTTNGNCAEFTPSGVYIRSMSNSACRSAVGSRVDWTTNGNCAEFTPSGVYIRSMSNSSCRSRRGARVDWTTSGNCAEFTPAGVYVRSMSNSACRSSVGSVINWTTSGNCAEFTPTGVFVRSMSNSACRSNGGVITRPTTPTRPLPTPPRNNPHRRFKRRVISLAESIISNVDSLENMANNYEYVEILQPIKKQAARLSARVQGRAGFNKVKNTLVHLDTLLQNAESFIEETLERDDSFYQAKELLTQKYKVRKLAQVMREAGSNHGNILY